MANPKSYDGYIIKDVAGVKIPVPFSRGSGGPGGDTFSGEHNDLIGRNEPDAHDIDSITDLRDELDQLASATLTGVVAYQQDEPYPAGQKVQLGNRWAIAPEAFVSDDTEATVLLSFEKDIDDGYLFEFAMKPVAAGAYHHIQTAPATTWNVQHNLGTLGVSVTLLDDTGKEWLVPIDRQASTVNLAVVRVGDTAIAGQAWARP